MDILKIGVIAVVIAFLCVMLKRYNGEYAIACGVCGCIILAALILGEMYYLFSVFYDIAERSGINSEFISIVLKITGIAYVGQISAELCKDAGEGAIASNVELCTKVVIMCVGMPVITSLFSAITAIAEIMP